MPNIDGIDISEDLLNATDLVLSRVRSEIFRSIKLQREGRFKYASSDPANTDNSNFKIAIEEALEVTKEMQEDEINHEHLEEEIVQASATFAGWLIARERRRHLS